MATEQQDERTPERPWGNDPWSVLPLYDGRVHEGHEEDDD